MQRDQKHQYWSWVIYGGWATYHKRRYKAYENPNDHRQVGCGQKCRRDSRKSVTNLCLTTAG